MNDSGESRKEATDRKMGVLSAKTKTRIGFWNVRTMYETGTLIKKNLNKSKLVRMTGILHLSRQTVDQND